MKDFLIKNAWPIFFIGLFSSFILEHTPMEKYLGRYSDIGYFIWLLSFYLIYLQRNQPKKPNA